MNILEMEWPPRSGKTARFPKIDRASWFIPKPPNKRLSAQSVFVTYFFPFAYYSFSDPKG